MVGKMHISNCIFVSFVHQEYGIYMDIHNLSPCLAVPMMERDKFMSADEAKEMGVIDEVLTSPPKVVETATQTSE